MTMVSLDPMRPCVYLTVGELLEIIKSGVKEELNAVSPVNQPKETESQKLLTRSDVARILSVSKMTVDRYSARGILHPYKIGSRVLFAQEDIAKLLEEGRNVRCKFSIR